MCPGTMAKKEWGAGVQTWWEGASLQDVHMLHLNEEAKAHA